MFRGKKYQNSSKGLDREKLYTLEEAMDMLLAHSATKFDSSCEIHLNTSTDPKYADQVIRSTCALPHGTGKKIKIVAFTKDAAQAKAALAAGALKAGGEELIEEVVKGFTAFDIAVATPEMMKDMGKVAKTLGPKGLMPNPKSGTVTDQVEKVVAELAAGKIEFKNDKFGIVHSVFGKISFGKEKLSANLNALLKSINQAKPTGVKGVYLKGITICSTMSPGIKIDLKSI